MAMPPTSGECLDEATLAALAAAPPGQGPPAAARHLASCPRCQRRFLARSGDVASVPPAGPARRPPAWRTVVVVVAMLVAILAALYGLSVLGAT